MIPFGMKSNIIQFLYRRTYKDLVATLSKKNQLIIDIGCGLGFSKPLAEKHGAKYVGIDPRSEAIAFAKKRYGYDGFIRGYFPDVIKTKLKTIGNGSILSLTTLDEIEDKESFLKSVNSLCTTNTDIFFSVRNSSWILNSNNEVITQTGNCIKDISIEEYQKLFDKCGFKVIKTIKSQRPIITSLTKNGVKTCILVLLDKLTPLEKSYLIGFFLRKNE